MELLVVTFVFGMLSVAIFNFFYNFLRAWKGSEAILQIRQSQNMVMDNLPISLKNMPPVKADGITDTLAYFGSLSNKYMDFVTNPALNMVSELSVSAIISYSNSSFIRFVSLSPTIIDSRQPTLYSFTYGVGNDKYLSEHLIGPTGDRPYMRLFRSAINEKLDDRLKPTSSLNADSPYYMRDYVNNVTAISMRYYDNYKTIWSPSRIGRGKRASIVIMIPCKHVE